MSEAGRKPLPTVLKVLRGTDRPGRLPKEEPSPEVTIPAPPAHVKGLALAEWDRVSKLLVKSKLLTEVDGPALAAYCIAFERWADAEEKIRAHGTIILTPKKYPVQSPYLPIANRAWDQMMKALTQFGMTPSSRSRVDLNPSGEQEPEW